MSLNYKLTNKSVLIQCCSRIPLTLCLKSVSQIGNNASENGFDYF